MPKIRVICCNRFGKLFSFVLFNKSMMGSAFVTQSFLLCRKCSIFIKILSLGVCGHKILETVLEICLVDQILDAVMKLAPIGFFSILKMQYVIFSCDFQTQLFNMFFIFNSRYSATGSVL